MMSDRRRPIPDDPLDWRPMLALVTRRPLEIRDPIVEPLWSGTRVLVHLPARSAADAAPPSARIVDGRGLELTAHLGELAAAVTASIQADDAVVDGVLTHEATRGGEGAISITEPRTSLMDLVVRGDPGVEVVRRDAPREPTEAFVAIDLLRLDGASLLDVPLLERKRLLESVIVQSERIRVSVHARPPVDPWVTSWKGAGLQGAMLKAANSRYVPGGRSAEWRSVTRVAGRR
jgi:ATP-dependent DNA ligase